jgi:hypothetical protein
MMRSARCAFDFASVVYVLVLQGVGLYIKLRIVWWMFVSRLLFFNVADDRRWLMHVNQMIGWWSAVVDGRL